MQTAQEASKEKQIANAYRDDKQAVTWFMHFCLVSALVIFAAILSAPFFFLMLVYLITR